jgi:hypothetical protein
VRFQSEWRGRHCMAMPMVNAMVWQTITTIESLTVSRKFGVGNMRR